MTPTIAAPIPPTITPALAPLETAAAPVEVGCALDVEYTVCTSVVIGTEVAWDVGCGFESAKPLLSVKH